MKNEKSAIVKRLLIYIVLAFAPFLIAVPILNSTMGGRLFVGELAASPVTALVTSLGMLIPAVASILTRLITKEGFHESYLRANVKGNMKFYFAAVLLPITYAFIGALLARSKYGAADTGLNGLDVMTLVISQTGTALIMAVYGLGEELGWRGYMMPKLEKLIGMPASILVGGVIWGLWYAPLTCSGHNFGTDYLGFPYVGIGMMCAMCVLMGCILTFFTRRTKSVYPAAILHMVNNSVVGLFSMLLISPDADIVGAHAILFIPTGIIAAVMFTLMLREKKHSDG